MGIVEAFGLGLVYGFGPCMTSCAPVLVPIVMSTSSGSIDGLKNTLLMGFGRLFAYVLLAMVFAWLGKVIDIVIPNYALGILMLLLGLALIFRLHTRCLIPKFRFSGAWMCFVSGLFMGFSPCAPMLGMLAIAAASKSILAGALVALSFGIATLLSPLIFIGLVAGKWSALKELEQINNYVGGIFLILISLFYFFR